MRIALVNNGTKEPDLLYDLLAGNEIATYASEDALGVLAASHDLIVLSGSSRYPIVYHLDDLSAELEMIRTTRTALIGICYGAELLTVAYGGTLRDTGHKDKGIYTVSPVIDDPIFGGKSAFDVYEAHRWIIDRLSSDLEVLAASTAGPEVIRHTTRPHYGFQFHPEKMCDQTYGDELFRSVLSRIT